MATMRLILFDEINRIYMMLMNKTLFNHGRYFMICF